MAVGHTVLLASPVQTIARWVELLPSPAFWLSIGFTMSHILLGFLLAMLLGGLLAALSAQFSFFDELLAPLLAVIRSTPVASFVIVALIWIPSRRLSILIAFLISLPILYAAVRDGIREVDPQLLEMAGVFHMPPANRVARLYLPSILPRLRSAAAVAIGLAWKSGIAAEVIGIPGGSIGEKLYKAKVYLATPDLFAWTLTIILLSALCERLFTWLLDAALRCAERS